MTLELPNNSFRPERPAIKRLIASLSLVHESSERLPSQAQTVSVLNLDNDEDALDRDLRVTHDRKSLDLDWLKEIGASSVFIQNKVAEDGVVVRVYFGDDLAFAIPPGSFAYFPCPEREIALSTNTLAAAVRFVAFPN